MSDFQAKMSHYLSKSKEIKNPRFIKIAQSLMVYLCSAVTHKTISRFWPFLCSQLFVNPLSLDHAKWHEIFYAFDHKIERLQSAMG